MRVFKVGNLVCFAADNTDDSVRYPNGVVSILADQGTGVIKFVNAQNGQLLQDWRRKSLSGSYSDIKQENGDSYGGSLTEVIDALSGVVNFSVVSGGGSTDLSPVYAQIATKASYAYVDSGITTIKGNSLVVLDTLEKLGVAIGNDPNFALTIANALAGKATPTDIANAIAALVDSSPAALNTLNELAAALGDDPNFATTVMTAVGLRELLSNKATNFIVANDQFYPTTKAVVDLLAGYVTATALTTVLSGYVTNTNLTTALANYVTNAVLTSTLANYVTNTTLAAYATQAFATSAANTAETNARAYADGLVIGILRDRGQFNASSNLFPSTGGSGAGGAIKTGDLWIVSTGGVLGGQTVTTGDTVRALTDSPGQTAANWAIAETNFGYVVENVENKIGSLSNPNTTTYLHTLGLSNLLNGYATTAQITALDPRFEGYVRGLMSFAGNATPTAFPAAGTYVKMAGTTTDGNISNNVTVSNGRLTYTGTVALNTPNLAKMVTMFGSIQGANNTTLSVGIAKNSVILSQFVQNIRITAANAPFAFAVSFPIALLQNDFVEPYVANLTNTSASTTTYLTFSI
jgi:hypothetical protein